jgi:H+/Na+-translocating ferredoxin:NAD+ oxidoreductase subunit B
MSPILIAVASMAGLGVVFAVGLVLASRVFGIEQDARIEALVDALPGINCGGCGYGGCEAYAQDVVNGAVVTLCTPGGPEVAETLARIMGVQADAATPVRAVLHCQGGRQQCGDRFAYVGELDCRAAHLTSGGHSRCLYGCLGLGTCATVCPVDAIRMSEDGLPVIDADTCIACGKCVVTCPRALISLLRVDRRTYLGCVTRDKGKDVKSICKVGCIGCGICARKDADGAIAMADNLPELDYEKSTGGFTEAVEACPMNCFVQD